MAALSEVTAQLERGGKNRAVGAHDMNERSSRSHMIFNVRGNRVSLVSAASAAAAAVVVVADVAHIVQ